MPIGTCDPATRGDAFNVLQLSVGNGDVTVTIRYGWDGTSTRATGCDGPLVNGTGPASNRWAVAYENLGATTYYMHTTGRNGQARTFTVGPGASGTLTAQQAANNGYTNRSDCDDLTLTTVP
jgi:hypothetical protein